MGKRAASRGACSAIRMCGINFDNGVLHGRPKSPATARYLANAPFTLALKSRYPAIIPLTIKPTIALTGLPEKRVNRLCRSPSREKIVTMIRAQFCSFQRPLPMKKFSTAIASMTIAIPMIIPKPVVAACGDPSAEAPPMLGRIIARADKRNSGHFSETRVDNFR
jgi:hypothetical protein